MNTRKNMDRGIDFYWDIATEFNIKGHIVNKDCLYLCKNGVFKEFFKNKKPIKYKLILKVCIFKYKDFEIKRILHLSGKSKYEIVSNLFTAKIYETIFDAVEQIDNLK